ncbi:DUF1648 domain-containing protein [Actinoplanes sp. NBRC 101535]|uniref:DUF1648 domain-containing protein n=1 Tax=Actinoplanes sp. NBRC 101535 TaxID=3032196 RepID=UPI0025560CDF|nr:DUF1648 domain-containing protein [Actinoplanes sp. NBRC 101535]
MRRRWAATALAGTPAVIIPITWWFWAGDLPDPIATHWNATGAADRFSATPRFAALLVAITVAAVITAIVMVARTPRGQRHGYATGVTLATAGAVTGSTAGMWVATATAAVANPADTRLGWRILFFLGGLAWGLVPRWAAGPATPSAAEIPSGVDPLDLGPSERAAYATSLRAPLLTGLPAAGGAVALLLALTGQRPMWLLVAVVAVVLVLFGRLRLTVDRRGLRLVAGLLGVPLKVVALSKIAAVEVMEINPAAWGGWGYRILPGSSAMVLRRGPGLVLHLHGGRRFAVTVDRPEIPAALLSALVQRVGA